MDGPAGGGAIHLALNSHSLTWETTEYYSNTSEDLMFARENPVDRFAAGGGLIRTGNLLKQSRDGAGQLLGSDQPFKAGCDFSFIVNNKYPRLSGQVPLPGDIGGY